MLSFVCSTREPNENFKQHIIKMCGLDKKKIEFLFYKNNGEYSLTNIYNKGLNDAKYDKIIFLHDDLEVDTTQFGRKILNHFEKNPEYGIIGVAGPRQLVDGCWWSIKKSMVGIVNHKKDDKKWTSKYSNDQGKEISEVVIVDGVFFAIDRTKIKKLFDVTVQDFHFYDITFCFENYLAGVKIGVITDIRITHFSIGLTNQKWLENKELFENKFKNNLPVTIKRVIRPNERLKILIGCLSFKEFTGSELYVFELAKGLIKEGHEVSICSTLGNPLSQIAKQMGIKVYNLSEPPGFRLGDNKWLLKTADGEIVSKEKTLYKVADISFDVIHLNHKPVTEHLLRMYPDTETICSIHSEVISLEEPVKAPQIKKYVAIRPEIKDYIVNKFGIDESLVSVIYNPIDCDRFKVNKSEPKRDKKRILFVGTIDYLRKNTIQDLIETTKANGEELWIVGKKNDTYLTDMIKDQSHVVYYPPTATVEKYIQQCDEVAGILLGRTTIEGWLCGKKAWIYDVDSAGNINTKTLHDVPADIDKFKSDTVVKQIIEEYKSILN